MGWFKAAATFTAAALPAASFLLELEGGHEEAGMEQVIKDILNAL